MTRWPAIVATLALALGATGCGDDDASGDEPRPPVEISVGATIAPTGIGVSPDRFGAGPIELLVSNQTGTSQRLELKSDGLVDGGRELEQSTGPINPGDTASLKARLDPGTYIASVQDDAVAPTRIVVGPPRPGAQDRLLQP